MDDNCALNEKNVLETIVKVNEYMGVKIELESIGEGDNKLYRLVEKTQINNTKIISSFVNIVVIAQIIANSASNIINPQIGIMLGVECMKRGLEPTTQNFLIVLLITIAEKIEGDKGFMNQCSKYKEDNNE